MAENKAIFLDRDGIINKERGTYTYKIEDFEFVEGIVHSLKLFREAGFLLIVISNQGGIAKERFTMKEVENLHAHICNELAKHEVYFKEIYYCPHHSDLEKCLCRKPGSLMIEKALARFDIDPAESYMFGDKQGDIDAAAKCGVKGFLVKENTNITNLAIKISKNLNELI